MKFDGRPRRRHGQGRGVGTFCWERGAACAVDGRFPEGRGHGGGSADGERAGSG